MNTTMHRSLSPSSAAGQHKKSGFKDRTTGKFFAGLKRDIDRGFEHFRAARMAAVCRRGGM